MLELARLRLDEVPSVKDWEVDLFEVELVRSPPDGRGGLDSVELELDFEKKLSSSLALGAKFRSEKREREGGTSSDPWAPGTFSIMHRTVAESRPPSRMNTAHDNVL